MVVSKQQSCNRQPIDFAQMRYYNPYKVGYKLQKAGYGISDIWQSVKSNKDMDAAVCGYLAAKRGL